MDGVDGLDPVIELYPAILFPQEHGNQSSVPVVGVDHVRPEVDVLETFQNGLGEIGRPLTVIIVAIGVVAIEVVLVVKEIITDFPQLQGKDAAVLHPPSQRNAEGCQELHLIVVLLRDLPELRQDHPHLTGGILQC